METAKLPKFEWGKTDNPNAGHTKEEWGNQEKKEINIIEAYDVSWNENKEDELLDEITSNASNMYMEDKTG